jgi:hypothetical protein
MIQEKQQKGSWETWLGPMAVSLDMNFCMIPRLVTLLGLQVNLRQLMHINLLYNASENNPTAVVSE